MLDNDFLEKRTFHYIALKYYMRDMCMKIKRYQNVDTAQPIGIDEQKTLMLCMRKVYAIYGLRIESVMVLPI